MRELIRLGAKALATEVNDRQISLLLQYLGLLIEANKKTNLTAITDSDEIIKKHFLDSMAAVMHLQSMKGASKGIDVGSGPGLPGIPVKILRSHDKMLMLDATKKKVQFMNLAIDKLGLKDISAVHVRAEDLARLQQHRQAYDYALSRAVAPLKVLLELTLPFVRVGGVFIAYKSKAFEDELRSAQRAMLVLGGKLDKIQKVDIYQADIERYLLVIKKVSPTPGQYPRKAGIPKKRPIQ